MSRLATSPQEGFTALLAIMQNIVKGVPTAEYQKQLASQFLFRLLKTMVVSDVLAKAEHQIYRPF
jgi:hypothetical protein